MSVSFNCLPVELHERVLSYLEGESLESASKVCRLWFSLASSVAKTKYEYVVLPECVDEVKKEMKHDEDDLWLQVLHQYNQQERISCNLLSYSKPVYCKNVICHEKHVHYVIYDSLCFISLADTIQVYDAESEKNPILSINFEGEEINQIHVVPTLGVLVTLSPNIKVHSISNLKERNEIGTLDLVIKNYETGLNEVVAFCVDGSSAAIQIDNTTISVFEMEVEDDKFNLTFVKSFTSPHMVFKFSLWNDELILLLVTGGVLKWIISQNHILPHRNYHEIRYRNPVWIYRGRIFCSTLISQGLLGLWHVNIATSYWLIGKPDKELKKCFNINPFVGTLIEEVTTVFLKQQLLFCGTREGKIVIFYLDNEFFDLPTPDKCFKLKRPPDLIINIADRPVEDIKVEFGNGKIYIVVKTVKVRGTVVTIQCIILSQVTEDSSKEGSYQLQEE